MLENTFPILKLLSLYAVCMQSEHVSVFRCSVHIGFPSSLHPALRNLGGWDFEDLVDWGVGDLKIDICCLEVRKCFVHCFVV